MAKAKFYTVWKGHKPGVYHDWESCRKEISNFTGALYKSFESFAEAKKAFEENPYRHMKKKQQSPLGYTKSSPILNSLSVDAACSGNPGAMEYQGVETHSKKVIFHQGPFPLGTNNIGEFLAIVHALALLKKHQSGIPVYTDSMTAMKWVREKKAKTKLKEEAANEQVFDLIYRAEEWLNNNSYPNKLLKWETKSWGEIPADFNRK